MQLGEHLFAMTRYHIWATERLLNGVHAMSEEHYRQDCGLFFKSVHGTLNHLLVADMNWYVRFSGENALNFALDHELEQDRKHLAEKMRIASKRWATLKNATPENGRDEHLTYTRVSGEKVVAPYYLTLAHVFNHGTHHRGQITAALTALGYPCPELDLMYMILEESK